MCMTKKKQNTDPFSAALVEFLWRTKTTQQELATAIGYKNRNMIQAIIDERSPGSEPKRRAIAKYFKHPYERFIDIGKSIIKGETIIISDSTPAPAASVCQTCKSVINLQDESDKKHQIVISGFQDKDMALAINEALVELESLDTDALKDVYNYVIKMKLEPAREKKGLAPLQSQQKIA